MAVGPDSLDAQRRDRPFFDQRQAPRPSPEYVCWIDLMGTKSIMLRSLPVAANFVMKIHIACLEAAKEMAVNPPRLYAAIDGLYICTPEQSALTHFLRRVMEKMATAFVLETSQYHRFFVKGAVAYGPVIHGSDCLAASWTLGDAPDYAGRILLGAPLAQANQSEKDAAPFGIYVHESARSFAPAGQQPFPSPFLNWWGEVEASRKIARQLRDEARKWWAWARQRSSILLYPTARMDVHAALFNEYFLDVDTPGKIGDGPLVSMSERPE